MTIRPLTDHILAKRVEENNRTSGGLFIPDNAKEKPLEAVVISVGSGKLLPNGTAQPIAVKATEAVIAVQASPSTASESE